MSGWTPRFIETTRPLVKNKGSEISCNGHKYVFRPNEHGAYVAEIPFERDYSDILTISAGYQPYVNPDEPAPKRNAPASTIPHSRRPKALAKDAVVAKATKVDPAKATRARPGVPAQHAASADPALG